MHMNNRTEVRKQNRILIVSAALLVAFVSVMILLVSLQGKETKDDNPLSKETDTSAPDVTSDQRTHVSPESSSIPETLKVPETSAAAAGQEPEAAPVITPEDSLPQFIAPVSGTLSENHSTEVPVYSLTMNDYRTHSGIDIAAEAGAAVLAAADGTIDEIWDDPMMGKCLRINHRGGAVSIYKNLASELPESTAVGTAVKAGTVIAAVGESALVEIAEPPHLHYELHIDGVSVDPTDFMLIGTTDTAYEG